MKLDEITSSWRFGPEYRSTSDNTNLVRWTAQTGLSAELSDGQKIGVTYRRRDNDGADGFNAADNGVWLEYSFPLWQREKAEESETKHEDAALQERVARLESELADLRALVAASDLPGKPSGPVAASH